MSRFRLLPSGILVVLAVFAGAWLVRRAVDRDARAERDGARLLEDVMMRVRAVYVEPVDEEELWAAAIAGMVDELGDPNSAYLTPERLERITQSASNSYRGVGLSVDVRDGWITVLQPRAGSPAERAGLQAGDRLVEIDGRSMRGWTVDEARTAMRGPLGTSIALVIERGASTKIPVTLERADIRVSAVARATGLPGGVG
jgi:carboxyl-terminal processing protease